ncbi:bifunctional copper resistance protein CopD/cytochrome c oxidase assembly protein [Corynebacterium lizhenjunii]|uniref:Bifunctional copper resistance protein CopD/cytochrome c oxidase assembly protein n=1 Tax=Corynebacterium lizhenjunii TaxID=2709394 RepID=A0A7T0KEI7_9CORY|nr:cytochrome c oxidase assembly protein [Corynebacterium lizhenjunii]QPK78805.1 bifunctional copper resistance protein CopD/cytochrome c oxidase assembly protein [Corynebacterium lizhenjunii]
MSRLLLPAESADAPSPSTRARGSRSFYLLAAVVAGVVAGGISAFFLADSLAVLGIPDPGRLTTFGLPFIRAVAWVLMAVAVGAFLSAAFLIHPAVGDNEELYRARLSVDGHIAARTGGWASLGVVVASLLQVPLVMSDLTGTPLLQVLNAQMFSLAFNQIATAQVWFVTALLAAVVAVGGLVSQRWAAQPPLLVLAVLMVVPLGMEGHSASGGDHDLGTNSYLWHLVAMMLWVGGLMALVAHSRRRGPDPETMVRRYSGLALFCVIAMALSGVVNAGIRVEFGRLLETKYGWIIVAKVVLTVVLALVGLAHRRLTIPQLSARPELFRRVAVVEVVIMAATIGVAGTMGRTPPPPPRDPNLNAMQIQLGYELHQAPTFWNVWTMFRFDVLFGTLGLLLAAWYVWALIRVQRRGLSWPWQRTAWWMGGALGLTVVMSNGIGMYIPALYSMHMLGHMVLSMVIPLFLVLGAPLTLVMEAWEPASAGKPGAHEWAVALTKSRALRVVTHPAVNLLQFLFFFYVVYMSFSLYQFAISEHAGHVIMNAVFLVSGYIYFWEVIGPDPLPHRAPTNVRTFILFISMPIHLYAGVYLMQLGQILGEEFYMSLNLPWEPDLRQDQRVGGGIAWGFGQFPLVIVFGKLFVEWLRDDLFEARRHDAKADLDGDADLQEYNAMLAALEKDGNTQHYRQL